MEKVVISSSKVLSVSNNFVTVLTKKTETEVELKHKYDLPIEEGDLLSVIAGRKKGSNKTYKMLCLPLVKIPLTSAKVFFEKYGNPNITKKDIGKVSRCYSLLQSKKANLGTVIMILKTIGKFTEVRAKTMLEKWDKKFDRRQLELFSVSRDEINGLEEHVLFTNKRAVINQIIKNPLVCPHISVETALEILDLYGRNYSKEQLRHAHLLREQVKKLQSRIICYNPETNVKLGAYCESNPAIVVNDNLYLLPVYNIERKIAQWLHNIATSPYTSPLNTPNFSRKLTQEQQIIINYILQKKAVIVSGEAGTGKTTILCELLYNLANVIVLAPTGAAANRLKSLVNNPELHQFIMTIDMFYVKEASFEVKHVIVDEASMLSYNLLEKLAETVPESASIVLCGDLNQLPPVAYGDGFDRVIRTRLFTVVPLKTNYRVAAGDPILINAQLLIRATDSVKFKESPNFTICAGNVQTVGLLYRKFKQNGYPIESITTICPFRKNGYIDSLNTLYWEVYGNSDISYCPGKRVVMTRNDYDANIMNGEEGVITSSTTDFVVAKFAGKDHEFYRNKSNKKLYVGDIKISFCRTVHTAQGSEYDHCVVYWPKSWNVQFLNRNMLYTAITRGRKSVWIIGDVETINKSAISRNSDKGGSLIL